MSSTIYWDKLRILVTNSCNYQCPFCHNEGQSSDKSIKTMDFDKFKIIIDALKDEDIHEICFSGGEPFLEKKLVEMIRYAYRETEWEISCASNLSLITKEQVQKLVGIPLKFNIQFPYTESEKFHRSTGNGFIDKIITNIRMIRNAGLDVGLNCVIQNDLVEDVRQMVEFALQEELPLKLLPQIGLPKSSDFKNFVFPILNEYAVSCNDKGTGAIRWLLKKGDKQVSVLYIDSPCLTHDMIRCRNYSEIRILPDMSLQPCIQRPLEIKRLDLTQGKESIKKQFREAWKDLKNCSSNTI